MKINLKVNSHNKLIIEFTGKEAEKIEKLWKEVLKLEKREISNLWGKGIKAVAWVDTDNCLVKQFESVLTDYTNDLNSPFISVYINDRVNVAFLRLIDKENRRVEIELPKLLNVLEFKNIVNQIREVMEKVFNLILEDVSIELKETKMTAQII